MASLTNSLTSNSPALAFELVARCPVTNARAAIMRLPHGEARTPMFMPVGTKGTMKGLTAAQLAALECDVVLANTYHLMLKPGSSLLSDRKGALRQWMRRGGDGGAADSTSATAASTKIPTTTSISGASTTPPTSSGAMLTDSGGFQMVSLLDLVELTEEGVAFASHYDTSQTYKLTPERSIEIQQAIGADIMMALDDVVNPLQPRARIEEAMRRSVRWLDRCLSVSSRTRTTQNLFPIIQGGLHADLRAECLVEMVKRDAPGYAIGGLSGGEDKDSFWPIVKQCAEGLPTQKPRYCMGVGYAVDLVVCTALGVDMFDCVYPTRTARFGRALVPFAGGTLALKRSEFLDDERLIDDTCKCSTCAGGITRAYLHSAFKTSTSAACRYLTVHNIAYQMRLMHQLRDAIIEGTFPARLRRFFRDMYADGQWPAWAERALQSVGVSLQDQE